ncbi:hypothetical protein F4821DRAFT_226833 [Hypoxylon rubiginosum]|uniref:Uncharacterized protein n=1 Tax=Hypoxylon rubiginosum TaxID=110542 RepID=A0ACC0DEM3_9PEZI|nr:hypothetical protein F4821DRAFT_226833 [Hypoxylon rubiginosum]
MTDGGHAGGRIGDNRESFVVDYEEEPVQVFKRFLRSAIKKSRSLDILCRPWAPITKDKDRLPSWMPTIARKPFQTTKGGRMIRYNSDPLVGAAVFRLKFYSASGLRDPNTDDFFEIDLDKDSRHIVVEAFTLSTIKEVWNSAAFGNIPYSWLEAGGWNKGKEQPPDELWRTLVADRTHEGNKADPWYPMAFQSAARDKELRYGINTTELIHEKNNAAYSEVFRRVQAVVWNRALIRTEAIRPLRGEDKEWCHLGLAPQHARKGDSICIVRGCSVPLILRPNASSGNESQTGSNGTGSQPTGSQNGNGEQQISGGTNGQQPGHQAQDLPSYTLIGDCYIDDMMDGQALAHIGPGWKRIKIE